MSEPASRDVAPTEPSIADLVRRERGRLTAFIRRRVADPLDAEDVLQDVFAAFIDANRRLMPIEHVTGWLYRAARNRIVDLFRKKTPERFDDLAPRDDDGQTQSIDDLLPSPDDGPEALAVRQALVDALAAQARRLDDLPEESRPEHGAPSPRPELRGSPRTHG